MTLPNLKNILWAIEKIESRIKEITTVTELVNQEEKYDSVIVKLMNIGESAFNLSEELKNKFENVDWRGMYKMRNIITHSYHSVDENIVWDIIKNELPEDKIEIIRILGALGTETGAFYTKNS
jgi:uncharacterized protein with HEPN domain